MISVQNPDLRYRNLWLTVGYMLLGTIIYLSVTSQPVDLDLDFPYQDKLMHALAYFVLMGWFVQIFYELKKRVLLAVAFIVMGVVLEYIQSFDPARYSEFADMVANTTGVLLAAFLSKVTSFGLLLHRLEVRMTGDGKRN